MAQTPYQTPGIVPTNSGNGLDGSAVQPAKSPFVFQGIGSGQRRTGTQTNAYLQGIIGRDLTPAERTQAGQHIGYTDATGNSEIGDADYNKLMQYAATLTGGQYQPGAVTGPPGQQPYPNTGPVYPSPYTPTPIAPAPTYTPPAYQQQTFQAPDWQQVQNDPGYQFRQRQGQGALEASAAARGMTRTGRTQQAIASFNQDLASQEYQNAYARAGDTFDRNSGERRFGYGAQVEGAQASYAPRLLDWNAQREQNDRAGELNFDRGWQRELYGRDDNWRQTVYNRDDAWRNYVLEEERRRFLATQGQNAAAS